MATTPRSGPKSTSGTRGGVRRGGGRVRRGVHRGDLHARGTDRAAAPHGTRSSPDSATARRKRRSARRRGPPDAGHPARFPRRARPGNRQLCGQVPRPGIVGLGLGGREAPFPPEPFERPSGGEGRRSGSVPHAGEAAGPASIRGAIETLEADRLRHGIRCVDDAGWWRRSRRGASSAMSARSPMCARGCRLDGRPSAAGMLAAGVLCSISTDDPAMFDTDLARDYEAAAEPAAPRSGHSTPAWPVRSVMTGPGRGSATSMRPSSGRGAAGRRSGRRPVRPGQRRPDR